MYVPGRILCVFLFLTLEMGLSMQSEQNMQIAAIHKYMQVADWLSACNKIILFKIAHFQIT